MLKRGSESAVWRQSTPRRWNSAMRLRIVAGLPIRRLAKPSSCPVESRDRRHEHHRWAPRVHTSARASCAGQRIYRPRGLSSPVRCALTRATESSSGGVGSAARRNERECDNQNDGHTHRVLRSLSISGGGGASTNLDASPSAGALGARTVVLEESHDEGIVRGWAAEKHVRQAQGFRNVWLLAFPDTERTQPCCRSRAGIRDVPSSSWR